MKVLIATDWYKPAVNGVVTSVESLTDGLSSLGCDVRILTLSADIHSCIKGNVTYIGSADAGRIYPNARLKFASSKSYINELIKWRPDIVHTQCEFSTFPLAKRVCAACGCPLVHTYHTIYEDFTHYFSPSIRFGKKLAAAFSKGVLAKTQAVIAPTEKIAAMLKGYGVKTPITVIPSGLELERFQLPPSGDRRDAIRGGFGFSKKDIVLLYLGRLALEKNIDELLTLFGRQTYGNLRLLLVGDGPYRDELEYRVKKTGQEGRIVFAGMVDPAVVAEYYRAGDIFVSASQSETQGLTYIEAMASGLPLLCRDDPCLGGVVESGVNGFVYHNAENFDEYLARLLSDGAYRRAVGETARKTAFASCSAVGFAQRVSAVYGGLLGANAIKRIISGELNAGVQLS